MFSLIINKADYFRHGISTLRPVIIARSSCVWVRSHRLLDRLNRGGKGHRAVKWQHSSTLKIASHERNTLNVHL